MKKRILGSIAVLMAAMMFTACGTTQAKPEAETQKPEGNKVETEQKADAQEVKTGLGVITSLERSKDATADADGQAQVSSMVAAVLVAEDGKILKVAIDGIQTKIDFGADGKIKTDLAQVFESKVTLGDSYGMKKNSGIGKEWYEQMAAFEAYAQGKTIEELKGISVTEEGRPAGDDLKTSVTVHVNEVIEVIELAVNNAKNIGATSTDNLGLAMDTKIDRSKDAGAEDGVAQAYTNYVVASVSPEGKVTSAIVDASQSQVTFDATGKITSDLKARPQTKVELGDSYGMKKNSGIAKEWYEQVQAFAEHVKGKTMDEIKAIELDGEGKPTGADLNTSVTIHVNDPMRLLEKAVMAAK
ncbi:MAG: hypothetical protein Q4A75_09005 [Peptostreptococcaceae bacterium]|nr:hypothetical protein [Peptostreptococcaceae bacterium]